MSKEGILPLDNFSVRSNGGLVFGQVTVSGVQGKSGLTVLEINAFGRTFRLSDLQLAILGETAVNGVQISCENGYERLGGPAVYIVLLKGFTSGPSQVMQVTAFANGHIEIEADVGDPNA